MKNNTVKITFGFEDKSPNAVFIHTIDGIYDEHLPSLGKMANSYTFEAKTDSGELVRILIANHKITAHIIK